MKFYFSFIPILGFKSFYRFFFYWKNSGLRVTFDSYVSFVR